jgi:hypothetical protein
MILDVLASCLITGSDIGITRLAALTTLARTIAIGAALKNLGVPEIVLCGAIDQGRWQVV